MERDSYGMTKLGEEMLVGFLLCRDDKIVWNPSTGLREIGLWFDLDCGDFFNHIGT